MVNTPFPLPHTETGGYRVGLSFWLAFQASYPFGELEITESELVLRTLVRCHRIPREHIRKLSQFRGLFSRGLRVEHSQPSCPRFVVFWSRRVPRLLATLAEARFPVELPEPSNHAMQLTPGRRNAQFHMTKTSKPAATRALARRS